ncbi:TetR/AcrR family transcriptional regulator [Mycobacterium sp. 21AC1]|uniref:TetR/AcrR family transcriptional regulator n=1 Tax=[Mycobacterium] appelbergii TaxID=2939269 RepID=UPI0029392C72|nr:helix-turn-helix domain-containing protein [Mycobacterium sp. 21AC1]MDV3130080.1 TetR/AcrR family transcriptional regulator [Mycobacterium sp. 21AC1]
MSSEPQRPALSAASITAAARQIADREGLAELTLRRIARELGTGPASLYRHIADRQQLLALLVDDLAGGYPLVDAPGPPIEQLTAQWLAMHDYLASHPWAARIIADGEHTVSSAQPVVDRCMLLLQAVGLDEASAHRTYRALWRLLIGHLLSRHPFGHLQGAPPEHDDFDWALRALLAGVVTNTEK